MAIVKKSVLLWFVSFCEVNLQQAGSKKERGERERERERERDGVGGRKGGGAREGGIISTIVVIVQ